MPHNRHGGPPGMGGRVPPHLASQSQFRQLHERVADQFGAFGDRDDEGSDEQSFYEAWRKPILHTIVAIFLASLFLWFVSHPTFNGPSVWAESIRLDTVFVVVWAPILFWVMGRQRVWKSVRIYLILALLIDPFSETMFLQMGEGGYWDSVLWPAGVAYFGTLKEFSGLPGGSIGTFTIVTVGLLYRALFGKKYSDYTPPPKFARNALIVFFGTVIALSAWGIAHGGQVDWTFRQTLHLMQLPLVGLVFLYVFRIPRDLAFIGTAYVLVAAARSVLVLYVYFVVCTYNNIHGTYRHGVLQPEWCTNHSDSVLFVTALAILLAHALEQRNRKTTLRCIGLGALIMSGIVFNNRRLAFVSLGAVPVIMYLALKPSKRKFRVTVAMAILIPLVVGYVLVGSEINSPSPLLKPAKLAMSVMDQKDTSAQSRDIENENLIYTLNQSPLLTTGFGHEYQNSPNNPPVDLSETFANYKLVAHNGVLWLWSIAGVLGFALMWMVYPLAGTLAMRGYRSAETPLQRSAALAALASIAVCVIQIWGDQGFSSYMTLVTFGVAFAVSARLAVLNQG